MRWLIETDNETVEKYIRTKVEEEKLELLDNYDKFERVTRELEKVKQALNQLQRSGFNQDVMIRFIQTKGVAKGHIIAVLNAQEDFFRAVGLV